jgi:transposase
MSRSTKSYSFYSKNLNTGKFNAFLKKAEAVRDYKNALSTEVSLHLLKYTEVSKFDFIKMFGTQTNHLNPSPLLRGNEIQKAAAAVFDAYQNKITQIKQKMSFVVQKGIEVEYYKRNTKHNKKGDVRSYEIKTKSTPLTKTLTFLARYGSEDTLEYVIKRAEQNDDKQTFYNTLKTHIEKFGLERLLKLAYSKRAHVLKKYNHPITFTSLTYRSALQSNDPLIQNSKNKSFANGTISIPSFNGRHMFVPTTFNQEHYGHLNQYTSKEYIICMELKRKRIRLITTKESTENISPEGTNHLGVDTNIKHNLFATSEGTSIDMDRDLFHGYVAFLKKYQDKKEHTTGEEQQFELWQERVQCMLKKKARELVDHAIASGKDHIIMEDLGNFGRSFVKSEEFEGFKYSRLTRLLNLASLNKIVKGICKKLGVRLTLIPSHYTSQWCFDCGHIDRANRTTQETFQCVCCNSTANADFHSSHAILRIGSSDVLKSSMLAKDKSFDWIPKRLSKGFIRKQLEEITTKPTFQLNCQNCTL